MNAEAARRVLVVDDEEGARDSLEFGLELAGYLVETAASATAAIEWLEMAEFDAVVLDLKMPGGSGFKVLELVVMDRLSIPVIIMTGDLSQEQYGQALKLGAFAYLQKPLRMEELKRSLSEALSV